MHIGVARLKRAFTFSGSQVNDLATRRVRALSRQPMTGNRLHRHQLAIHVLQR